jgi:hypothetical protein
MGEPVVEKAWWLDGQQNDLPTVPAKTPENTRHWRFRRAVTAR